MNRNRNTKVISDDEDSNEIVKIDKTKSKKMNLMQQIKQENIKTMKNKNIPQEEKLQFLIKQTEIYTHFLMSHQMQCNSEQKKKSKSKHRGDRENEYDDDDEEDMANTTRLYSQPSSLKGGQLKSYQLDGLNWMISLYENSLNGILADEMGLGKTIQTISFISFIRQFKQKKGFFIIIVPKSTMPNWHREIKKWTPDINLIVLNPIKEEREESLKLILQHKFDVVITSYEGVNICMSSLKKIQWEALFIDEAHRIKNENALLSKNVRNLNSNFRLLVTGTPLQNNLHELWALLNFLLPDLFSSSEDFDVWFGDNDDETQPLSLEEKEEKSIKLVQKLHKIIKPFLLRRTKSEVERSLPPKKEIHIKIGLTELQKDIYKKLLKKSMDSESKIAYKNIIMQLRKVCNHPYLFEGVEDYSLPDLGEHLIKNSSKMRILDKLVTKLMEQKNQVLIFSQMTRVLDILEDYLNYKDLNYCRIDGNTSLEDRETQISDFTSPNSEKFCFLLSTRAGGLGINLMTANTVVLFDSDWNPQVDLQAMDRIHRIGQTKNCTIYRFISENTIEEKIIERQAMRLKLDSMVIQQGRINKSNENFSKEQMKDMIQYGADAILKTGDDFKDEDIDKILEEAEKGTDEFYKKAEQDAKQKFNLLLDLNFTGSSDLYKFEDEDYLKKRQEAQDALLASKELDEYRLQNTKRDRNLKLQNLNFDQNLDLLLNHNKQTKKKYKNAKVPFYHLYRNRERLVELKQKQINAIIDSGKKIIDGYEEDLYAEDELTTTEYEEMVLLAKSGFPDWDKKEYETFISIVEKYGHSVKIENIKEEILTKSDEEIQNYLKAFWERALEVPDGARIVKNIEKKDKAEKHREHCQNLLSMKAQQTKAESWEDIKLVFPSNANRHAEFTIEEDQFLVYVSYKFGYGNWETIIREIKLSDDFMFNYYLKSRDKNEINKRLEYLVRIIEKEYTDNKINTKHSLRQSNKMEIDDESNLKPSKKENISIYLSKRGSKANNQSESNLMNVDASSVTCSQIPSGSKKNNTNYRNKVNESNKMEVENDI